MSRISHTIPPVFDSNSRILILGSFPSVKSREGEFFYHHPQNRFWKVLSNLLQDTLPITVEDKKRFLITHRIALWDVIKSCEITGSSDSSIKEVIPNDIQDILETANIEQIFTNGATATKLFRKYIKPKLGRDCFALPSTSPANASNQLEDLLQQWSHISNYLGRKS